MDGNRSVRLSGGGVLTYCIWARDVVYALVGEDEEDGRRKGETISELSNRDR